MNSLSFLTNLYGKAFSFNKFVDFGFKPVRRFLKLFENIPFSKENISKINQIKGRKIPGLIVSLTSFPQRIPNIYKNILSIRNQSVVPEKIILWLSTEQFPDKKLPDSLLSLQDDLFEIRFVDGDIRSHKKYYYAFKNFPDKDVITLDDDTIYHPFTLEYLVNSHLKHPDKIIANTTRFIAIGPEGPEPYLNWKANKKAKQDKNLLQIGMGGVLYPKGVMPELTLNKDLFMSLTPYADDIWLNAMARLNDVEIVQSENTMNFWEINQKSESLTTANWLEGRNDLQINKVREYFLTNYNKEIY